MSTQGGVDASTRWTAEAYAELSDLGAMVDTSAAEFADDVYVFPIEDEIEPLTFARVQAFVRGFEVFLEENDIGEGENCAVIANSGTSLLLVFIALTATGRVFVPINPNSSADDISYIVTDSSAKAVLYDVALEEKASFLRESAGLVPFEDGSAFVAAILARAAQRPARASAPSADAVAEVVYTTGTTGRPKGVRLTHRNLIADLFGIGQVFGFARGDRFLTITPLFHNSGQIMTSLIPLYCGGATTAVRPDMGFINFWYYIERFRPEWTLVMPSHIALMLDRKTAPAAHSLRGILCGGAKLEPATQASFEARFAVPIYPNYGLTESASIATCARPGDGQRADGSVGRPLDINEVRIFDGHRQVAPMEVGEIRIRGDNVFTGYVNLPQVFAEKVQQGWLRTGDLGFADEGGYIHIVDRIDNMVIVGGENIYPSEVERFVPDLDGVSEGFLLSLPDRIMGRELVLVYGLRQDAEARPREWKSLLFTKLAPFKVPRRFVDVQTLGLGGFPRAPNGKLLRKRLQLALEAHFAPQSPAPAVVAKADLSRMHRELATLVAGVLEIDHGAVTGTMHMDQVPSWDSMNHLRLMTAIEDHFGVTLTPGQMSSMTSVDSITRVLVDHHHVGEL